MKRREDKVLLADILASINLAQAYVQGQTLEMLLTDNKTQDALVKRIEVIGEAASKLSPATLSLAPQLPWQSIIGMRHILVHDYFGIDVELVWRTATQQLPELYRSITALLPKLGP